MSLSLIKKVSVTSAVGLAALFILVALIHMKDSPHVPPIETKSSPYPVRITGLEYKAYEEGRLLSRVQADAFKVSPRRFWAFNIRPFNEAVLTNARVELYFYKDTPPGPGASLGKLLIPGNKDRKSFPKEMGLITRGVIKGLHLKIYQESKPAIIVRAGKAEIDFKKNEARLTGASLEDPASKNRIEAKSIIWDNRENVFTIPGEYVAVTSKGMKWGKGIRVDMVSSITPLNPMVSEP